MTKTIIVGDTHADSMFVSNIHRVARDIGAQTIVQVGDFGFTWDHNMMASIAAWLDRDPAHRWYWVDGNHDDHETLRHLVEANGWDVPIRMPKWHDRLFYVPRGAQFTIGDTRCMGFGGAYSIDKDYRKPYVSWWPEELITTEEMYRVYGVKDIDVMFTHDGPYSEYLEAMLQTAGYKVDPHSYHNRMRLSRVVDEVRPDVLYHGHYHRRYTANYQTPDGWDVQIEGIGANVDRYGRIDHTAIYDENYKVVDF